MLKIFILVLVLATLNTLEAILSLHNTKIKCRNKFNITRAEMADLFIVNPQWTDRVDRKFKCYYKCVMDELNYKDADGKTDMKSVVIAVSDESERENALKAITDCESKYIMQTDECERIIKIFICYRNKLAPLDSVEIIKQNCRLSYDVTISEMIELMFELKQDTDEVDSRFKCFTKCLVTDLNYTNKNGRTDFNSLADVLTLELENSLAATDCESKFATETDNCERIFRTFACVFLSKKSTTEHV